MAELCPYAPEEIPKRIGSTDLVTRFESGQVPPEQFVEQLCAILGLRLEYARFCEIWSSIFLPYTLIPESLLEGLRRRYRVQTAQCRDWIMQVLEHHPADDQVRPRRRFGHLLNAARPHLVSMRARELCGVR